MYALVFFVCAYQIYSNLPEMNRKCEQNPKIVPIIDIANADNVIMPNYTPPY